ncbi:FKBP-type peptidyl-prolyl cis-trans isomerase [Flavobacterium sp.]|uniref:FKBP-type peptidyl-prolyl cis-trans isomerase n=1 Tax=Flavobacterium sp. TaxID=239 RepID=UPI00352700A1
MLLKRLKNVLLISVFAMVIFSCKKDDDDVSITPPRDRTEQYNADKDSIQKYLETHYMTVDANMNVMISEIPSENSSNYTSIIDQTDYPLQFIEVKNDNRQTYLKGGRVDDPVDYKLYYIILNEGGGQRPTTVDSSFVDYRGWNFSNVEFDRTSSPVWTSFPSSTNEFISGFRQILPLIKTPETVTENADGTFTYTNYGNCVVFIPSGLAYFNLYAGINIPAYSNIAFQIKLKGLRYNDHDRDKILSKDEIYNPTGDTDIGYFNQDSDGDGIPDFLDTDDDADGILTRNELKIPGTTPQQYYQFNDIPDCSGDQVNPNRLKKHLDSSCQ